MNNKKRDPSIRRRTFLKGGTVATAGTAVSLTGTTLSADPSPETDDWYQDGKSPWRISLDTATIGWGDLEKTVEVAERAGFDAIEPWMRQLEAYEENGGDLEQLGKQIKKRGLDVPSVIGLWDAIPHKRSTFESSLKDTRRRMRMASDLGANHVQTIPAKEGTLDLNWAAEAYGKILEIGLEEYDILPALVFVKFFSLKTFPEAAHVALMTNHPQARIIPDTFHMHISGSGLNGLRHLNGDFIAILQFNDAPSEPAREDLSDSDRVMPGDGILPLKQVLRDLHTVDFDGCISLELYNPKYQEMDSLKAAKLGLNKTVGVIHRAMQQ
jgi:sugar phosphate isomerase/epimerase